MSIYIWINIQNIRQINKYYFSTIFINNVFCQLLCCPSFSSFEGIDVQSAGRNPFDLTVPTIISTGDLTMVPLMRGSQKEVVVNIARQSVFRSQSLARNLSAIADISAFLLKVSETNFRQNFFVMNSAVDAETYQVQGLKMVSCCCRKTSVKFGITRMSQK